MRTETLRGAPALLALAVGALVVLPIAFAGADGPSATTSASAKQMIKGLKKRVAALEAQDTLPPSGPAGGDLTGDFPGPQLRVDSVGSGEILQGSVGSSEVGTDAIGKAELGAGSVGADELLEMQVFQGQGVAVAAGGASVEASVTCPAGWMLVGGGYEWGQDVTGTRITYTSPSFVGDPNTTWVVRGRVDVGAPANTLFAEANCLAV
jgi:hypothetical protein